MPTIEELKRRAMQGDEESQYQLAFEYWDQGDYPNVVACFEKIVANPRHSRYGKSVSSLAQIHEGGLHQFWQGAKL